MQKALCKSNETASYRWRKYMQNTFLIKTLIQNIQRILTIKKKDKKLKMGKFE